MKSILDKQMAAHHPGGMADNSPPLQRWDVDSDCAQVPKGRLTMRTVSRPFGTYCPWICLPLAIPSRNQTHEPN